MAKTVAAAVPAALGAGEAGFQLVELHNGGIQFALLAAADDGYWWYLPNPDGPAEQEDWVFHALKSGHASSLEEAVTQLCAAAKVLHPESDFARSRT